jgi:hypothetical protein
MVSHGRGMTSQLTDGVGLAINFGIASEILEIWCGVGFTWSQTGMFWCLSPSYPLRSRLTLTVSEEEPMIVASSRPSSPEPHPSKGWKVDASSPTVKCCIPRYLRILCTGTDRTVKDLSPFCIQKVQDQLGGTVKNESRFRDGCLPVEKCVNNQAKKRLSMSSWVHAML